MNKNKGFSLIELLIVVAVTGIISAIAVPNLMQSRLAANEASAMASIRNLVTAEITYASTSGTGAFGSMDNLVDSSLVDAVVGNGVKNGYSFTVHPQRFYRLYRRGHTRDQGHNGKPRFFQ